MLITAAAMILLVNHRIIFWDDYSHWGTMPKQVFYLHRLPGGADSLSGYSDYQPIGTIFLYAYIGQSSGESNSLRFILAPHTQNPAFISSTLTLEEIDSVLAETKPDYIIVRKEIENEDEIVEMLATQYRYADENNEGYLFNER